MKASTLAARAEAEDTRAENTLPDPTVELERLWGSTAEAGGKFALSVSQEFEFPTVYGARSKAANLQSTAADALHDAAFLDKVLEAKLIILEIIYTNQCLQAKAEIRDNLLKMLDAGVRATSGGEISVLDRNKLSIELALLDADIASVNGDLTRLLAELSDLAGGADLSADALAISAFPDPHIPTIEEYRAAMASDPQGAYTRTMLEASDAQVKAINASRLPTFSLGYTYNAESGMRWGGVNFGVSIPLYSRRASRRAIDLRRDDLTLNQEMLETSRVASARADIENAHRLQTLIATMAPAVNDPENARLLRVAYDGGHITLHEYLGQLNYFTEARLQLLRARFDLATAAARLNRYNL